MQGTCLWRAEWGGVVDKNYTKVAGPGKIEFRASNRDKAISEIARAFSIVFGEESHFVGGNFVIKKIQDNPLTRIGDGPIEDITPKLLALRNKQRARG